MHGRLNHEKEAEDTEDFAAEEFAEDDIPSEAEEDVISDEE